MLAELEGQLSIRTKEVEEVREARAKDAQDLLANAKERLTILHAEVSQVATTTTEVVLIQYSSLRLFVRNHPLKLQNINEHLRLSSPTMRCSNTTRRNYRIF